MVTTEGRTLLVRFLADNDLQQVDAARALGVSKALVSQWVAGNGRPSHHLRLAIERWSSGKVPVNAWLTKAERKDIDAVEPAKPSTVAA